MLALMSLALMSRQNASSRTDIALQVADAVTDRYVRGAVCKLAWDAAASPACSQVHARPWGATAAAHHFRLLRLGHDCVSKLSASPKPAAACGGGPREGGTRENSGALNADSVRATSRSKRKLRSRSGAQARNLVAGLMRAGARSARPRKVALGILHWADASGRAHTG